LAGLPDLTPEQRVLRAQIAVHTRWAATPDRSAATEPARKASPADDGYWELRVDPELSLSPEARRSIAQSAKKAHFKRLAYLSSRARSRGVR
jgi:hypothetical protein